MAKDPYRPQHKAIRNRLFEVGKLSAITDYSEKKSALEFKKQFDDLIMFLEQHGQHEDQFIDPLLRQRNISEVKQIQQQHANLELESNTLKKMLNEVTKESGSDKWKLAHKFYLKFQRFVSIYLSHLHYEETIILPLMQENCSEAEFKELAKADFAGAQPEQLRPMLSRMLPSFNVSDIALILSDIKQVVPQETFTRFCDVFQDEMLADDWTKTKSLLN